MKHLPKSLTKGSENFFQNANPNPNKKYDARFHYFMEDYDETVRISKNIYYYH